jgi:hypothetical protein
VKGSVHGLFKVLSQHLPGGTEENHEKVSYNSWSPNRVVMQISHYVVM